MFKSHRNRLTAVLAIALLALAPAALVQAEEMADEVTLTGQLSRDDEGGYYLVELASGDVISLEGPNELDEHVGSTVEVTGKWIDGDRFKVSKVKPAHRG